MNFKPKSTRKKRRFEPIESTPEFNFLPLIDKIKRDIKIKYALCPIGQRKQNYPGITDEEIKDNKIPLIILRGITREELSKFSLNGQNFEFTYQEMYYKGDRWYVACPKCKKKCHNLYLPTNFPEKEQRYLCRKCHDLKNTSNIMASDSPVYFNVIKPLKRLEKIKKLISRQTFTPKKVKKLLREYKRIEKKLSESPEYRLWKLRKMTLQAKNQQQKGPTQT